MTTGTGLLHRIMLAIGSRPDVRIFRNNVALAWVGKSRRLTDGTVIIKDARPLHAGLCIGSSDLIGYTSRIITAADVGKRIAIFTAIESKDGGRPSKEQKAFILAVKNAGGIAGLAHSEAEAVALVE